MTPPPQPEYIITAQRLKDYEDNLPQYIIVDGCKCDRDTTIAEIRSHPCQSDPSEMRFIISALLRAERKEVIDDIETVIDKTTSYVSRYELERKIAEHRQAGEPQYQCGDNCKGECSGEVDGVVHCPYNPQAERDLRDEFVGEARALFDNGNYNGQEIRKMLLKLRQSKDGE